MPQNKQQARQGRRTPPFSNGLHLCDLADWRW